VRRTTPEERARVAGWVRERLPRGHGWSDDYRRRVFGDLLLQLEGDTLDDAAYLAVCRETGKIEELVERLLRLGRRKEALRELEAADDHGLLPLADLFVQHAHADDAEKVVRARAAKSEHPFGLLNWLKARAEARGDAAEELALTEQLFGLRPDVAAYDELRRLVGPAAWPAKRAALLRELERRRADWLLVSVYLKEGEVEKALAVVKSDWGRHSGRKLDVAKVAEKEHPREALELYRDAAERLIEQRGRDAYKTACGHLKRVRELYRRLGEESAWATYVVALRDRFRSLRAFREELDRAKL